jgi:hypothetical protein
MQGGGGCKHAGLLMIIAAVHPDEKERVRARFIIENTRFLHQISHGTAPNRLFPVRSKIKLRQERFGSVRVRTFGY